jgi:hypothetical protein
LLTAILAVIVLGVVIWGGVALAGSGGDANNGPLLGARPTSGASEPRATPTPAATTPLTGVTPSTLPGCSDHCRIARSLRVTVGGQPADLLLVSTAPGRPLHSLRFYLLRDADHAVLWSGPQQPMKAYVSKRLGTYHGSVLRQDATGHVFVDLLTSANESFLVVLDLGNGRTVRDFGSTEANAAGHYRFSTNSPGADTVDVDGAHVFDIAMPRSGQGQPYYDLYRWNGADYVTRGCARTLVDGGLGTIQPQGTCL